MNAYTPRPIGVRTSRPVRCAGVPTPLAPVLRQVGCAAGPNRTGPPPERRPKLVAFDLDATLWFPEFNEQALPFSLDPVDGRAMNADGVRVELLGNSQAVLEELATDPAWKGTHVAYVSRSEYSHWGVPCMHNIPVTDDVTVHDVAHHKEVYAGTKEMHFGVLHKRTGIDYKDMLFFDNEIENIHTCEPLGITCVFTPDGMTEAHWQEGLKRFAANAAAADAAGSHWQDGFKQYAEKAEAKSSAVPASVGGVQKC